MKIFAIIVGLLALFLVHEYLTMETQGERLWKYTHLKLLECERPLTSTERIMLVGVEQRMHIHGELPKEK